MENQLKLSGDFTIGFLGRCVRCKNEQRAYYYFADHENRRRMKDGSFKIWPANCPGCVTNALFSSPNTMEWLRQLDPKEVIRDLPTLVGGIQIDFDQAETEAKKQEKDDIDSDNYQKKMDEYRTWKKKR